MISPDTTRNCSQIKRFLVPFNDKYLYSMHVTYRDDLKCQSIYDTNKSLKRILRSKMLMSAVNRINEYPQLKADILSVIKLVVNSWEFDGLITDIEWLQDENLLDTVISKWKLKKYESSTERGSVINLLIKSFDGVPLNLLSHLEMKKISIEDTDIEDVKFKCPLILMRSNSSCAGFISKSLDKGLPVSLFKIDIKE
ncbi:hypothetical protein EVB94_329 [Rhizobium phage RHph_TM40]|uniref:Uncharacterized protein n=2 Tax=Cuauhnahuacvirus TaxID=3044696 RepID=A0A7S5R843_9CAUD|nr:hypothetical protein PQC16_gp332 [Rhizobium phage RHph_TM30]YP_010671457.1 hypothetical protein PQC17_gp333 [Rhizobium phage RHph_Y65]QIG71780.1 hypothetical protein EVB94_329 [Rhizobium phage RHph_TM40]QIG72141.1 hypothetical protein EVB95_327 [Rhizobium phage RHph_TM2_3B]QIG72503.1 hypothetical protein EVB96_327 [Rhizobium phage RHph_TM3_3_6]QIG71416.1 hypothetical protein EVB93_329 [Rhizobium phage RHph_TM30]QIG72866.1 hypothetical protein EVB97_328 [Rhizobium phage RHph_Y65]